MYMFCVHLLVIYVVIVNSVTFIYVFIVPNGFVACVEVYDQSGTPESHDDYILRRFGSEVW
jgi:hypothetical protein